MDFNKKLSKLLGNDKSIEEVQIDSRVIDEIVNIAIKSDPNEYVALLSGKIQKNILKITGLIFLPFKASESSAVMEVFMMPITTKAYGSVHSHPGPSANPSEADLRFFAKNGYFHMIICRPYSQATIRSYDAFGNPIPFIVKDLDDEIEIKQLNEEDFDEELFDESFFKEEAETDEEISEDNSYDIDEKDEKKEELSMSKQENNQTQINSQQQVPTTLNLEIDIKGKKVIKEIPLPPEYEPGDQVEVDIRTDKTPNDDIDEINLHIKKAPQNIRNNNKIITVTPQKVSTIKTDGIPSETETSEKTE
ncbi:MAG: hypothetical protein BZ138_05195, partial [Methanosphaera sp. rholeuAM270]